jgi:hypothetical protein
MAILDLIAGNTLFVDGESVLEPTRFLAAAAMVVETTNAPEQLTVRHPAVSGPCVLLDEQTQEKYLLMLRMRGLKIDSFLKLNALKDVEGAVIIFSQNGSVAFKGPIPSLPTFLKFDWSGIAERIEIYPDGDVDLINRHGVFGRFQDNASTRVMMSTDPDGDMVVRSLDKDPTGAWRPIAGEFALAPDGVKESVSPYEVRISLDPICGVRQTEKYSKPTSIVLNNVVHKNVLLVQHTPAAGVSRVESLSLVPGKNRVYHVSTTYCF